MNTIKWHVGISAATVLSVLAIVLSVVRADTTISYSFLDRGGVSLITRGGTSVPITGYARIQPNSSNTAPAGLAIFGYRPAGVLVSEAGVPASPLIRSGRIYAEVNSTVNTGIAIANPNSETATISFSFTNSSGTDFGAGSTTIGPNGQIAAFLDQAPFNGGNSVSGTFTFNSSVPVSVIALRGLTNERSEFLITTLPVADLSSTSTGSTIFPHFADGGGWTTQVVLVNSTDNPMSGSVQFYSQGTPAAAGQLLSITVNGETATTFSYNIPRRSSVRLQTSGAAPETSSGTVRINPASSQGTPSGLAIFSYKSGGVTVSEAGVPASRPSTAFRLYAEASSPESSILTGVAIANPSAATVTVGLEVTPLIGGAPILTGNATIPANGQTAKFLTEIQGLESLPRPFKGVLRVSTSSPTGIAVIGLRSRVNERGDFLITTTPPTDETIPASAGDSVFPHFADNGGYTTQFILYSGADGQQSSGQIRIIGQNGQPLDLGLAAIADLSVNQTGSPDPVPVGNDLTYTITVTNNGPAAATNVQVTDTLQRGVSLLSANTTQGTCFNPSDSVVTCNLGTLSLGASRVVTIVVRPPTAGTITSTASVTGSEDDSSAANNRSTVSTRAAGNTDLAITQSGPVTCNIGGGSTIPTGGSCDSATYVVTVLNNGPSAAANVTVTDVMPIDPASGAIVSVRVSAVPSQGSCTIVVNGRFSCNVGTMPSGAARTINIVLAIDSTAIGRAVVNSTSVESSDIVDSTDTNNTSTVTTNVTPTKPETDLRIVQFTANAATVTRPNPITLTGTIVNNGRSTATGVLVTTTFSGLAGTLTLQSATSTQGICFLSGATVVCNIGTLVKNSQKTISIRVVPSNSGTLNVNMTIAGNPDENDPQQGNNSNSLSVNVN